MAAFQARARSATRPPPRRCYQPGRRRPFALTISIRPQPDPVPFSGGSETIIAGTNPGGTPSRPARYALRHENKSWLEIPCRRAVAEASRGPDRLSSTMRTFASCSHRRRRPVSTISRRLMGRVSVRLSIPTVSYIPPNSARRPTPDEYRICDQPQEPVPALSGREARGAPPPRSLGTRAPMMVPMAANDRWSLDFVSDQLSDGRRFRILTIVDDCTRESWCWWPIPRSPAPVWRGTEPADD
jgi:hypothetical protein